MFISVDSISPSSLKYKLKDLSGEELENEAFKQLHETIIKGYESVTSAVKEYLKETSERDFQTLYDEMFIDDSITGNASGSYTFSTWQAEENIAHNMDLLKEALEEFGGDYGEALEKGAEHCDVTIRCYLLGQVLQEVLEELEEEEKE